MSAALDMTPPATLEEFLKWERFQEVRHEWDSIQPIAMTGGTLAHSELASRLSDILRAHLRGTGCTVVRGDVKILTTRGDRARYPDVVVTCSPVRGGDQVVPDPVLIIEVLSESTAGTDRGVKRAEYAALSSLRRYVILPQDEAIALIYDCDHDFVEQRVRGALQLPEFDLSISLAPLYEGLIWSPSGSQPA